MNIILLTTLLFTYINSPVAEMRRGPSQEEKVDSQGIHSERVEILEEKDDWANIKTPDAYTGWTKKSHLFHTDHPFLENQGSVVAVVNRKAAHVYHINDTEWGPIKTLPYESKLEVIDQFGNPEGRWIKVRLVDNTFGYIQRGDVTLNKQLLNRESVVDFAKRFMDLPYTWGGRTSFGYDCSGFMQMIYRQMGYSLPRNSRDQAEWEGFRKIEVSELSPGDLVFFGRVADKITHVGMYIGNDEFIHATVAENKPYITVSNLNQVPWNGKSDYPYRHFRTNLPSKN